MLFSSGSCPDVAAFVIQLASKPIHCSNRLFKSPRDGDESMTTLYGTLITLQIAVLDIDGCGGESLCVMNS